MMDQKISLRIQTALQTRLQAVARTRGVAMSALIRGTLERVVDGGSRDQEAPVVPPDTPPAMSPDLETCVSMLMAQLPREEQAVMYDRARVLGLPITRVVLAGLIQAFAPAAPAEPSGRE